MTRRRPTTVLAAALAATLGAASLLPLGGCMTRRVLHAQQSGTLVKAPDHRIGGEATDVENQFANGVVGFVLFPFALIGDILLFPVQLIRGDPPYGARED